MKVGDKVTVRRNETRVQLYGEEVVLLPYSIEARVVAIGEKLILRDENYRLYDQHFYLNEKTGVWENPYGLYVVERSPAVVATP